MKQLLSFLIIIAAAGFTFPAASISGKEKKDAVSYFKETQKFLIKETRGLSEAQLNWKPADSVWSIANCIEHITLSEKNLFDWAMSTLTEPADPSKRSQLKSSDNDVKSMITDRSKKFKAREGFIPSGQFGDASATLKVFKERRANLINYVKNSSDDLRNHFAQTPAGLLDSYQLLLLISAHSKRHTLQIVELKAMPGFPKS